MKCAAALSQFEDLEEPADIEEAVIKAIPKDQPQRDETIETFAKMMKVELSSFHEEDEMINAIVSAATLRVVQKDAASGRGSRSSMSGGGNRRMSADDTLDIVKIVVVGDSGTGKTCLMLRFTKDEFVTSTRATIGMDFCTRQLAVDVMHSEASSTVQRLTVQVWDTAGQEQFHSLTATYYRKAGGVMIVYDSTSRASFESLPKWLQQVDENAEGVVKMIVASKVEGTGQQVDEAEGREFAVHHGCMFASTSSKSGSGVMRAFQELSSQVLANQENKDEERQTLWLAAGKAGAKGGAKKGGCC